MPTKKIFTFEHEKLQRKKKEKCEKILLTIHVIVVCRKKIIKSYLKLIGTRVN